MYSWMLGASELRNVAAPRCCASSPACRVCRASEALTACFQLLDVNFKNLALVEGIICQIVEPDMQQTASYLLRVVDKDAKKAQTSLHRHNVRISCSIIAVNDASCLYLASSQPESHKLYIQELLVEVQQRRLFGITKNVYTPVLHVQCAMSVF